MAIKLDIDSLRTLKSVADSGGVTRAARHLALSQSAVSHKIKRLEQHIGDDLLSRRPDAPLLTQTGERLLAYANRIVALHDEAAATVGKRSLAGSIRMGMTEDMSSSGLAAILGRFARVFPGVSVRTSVAQSLILQRDLDAGAIDIAVMQVFGDEIRRDDRVMFTHRLCWAKARDMRIPETGPVPFLSYNDDCIYKRWMVEHAPSTGRHFATVLECSSNAGIIAAVEAGLGIAIVNERHVSPAMDVIEDTFHAPPEIAYVVRVSATAASNAVRVLADEIVKESADETRLRVA